MSHAATHDVDVVLHGLEWICGKQPKGRKETRGDPEQQIAAAAAVLGITAPDAASRRVALREAALAAARQLEVEEQQAICFVLLDALAVVQEDGGYRLVPPVRKLSIGSKQSALADALFVGVDTFRRLRQPDALNALATALVRGVERVDRSILDKYLQCHVQRCSYVDPRGSRRSAATQDLVLPLEDVYISLLLGPDNPDEVRADRAAADDDTADRDELLSMDVAGEADRVHFAELLRTRRWSVVLGAPGAGKTTLTRWLALVNARALLTGADRVVVEGARLGLPEGDVDLGPARLPILVRVADYADAVERARREHRVEPAVLDFLGHHPVVDEPIGCPGDDVTALIRAHLDKGRALVLLDGLDEIIDPRVRRRVVERVQSFVRERVVDPTNPGALEPWATGATPWTAAEASAPAETGGNQVLITSRIAGYSEAALAGAYTLVRVLPLEPAAVRRFARDWCVAVERFRSRTVALPEDEVVRRAEVESASLVDSIERTVGLRQLAENALMLTVLAVLHREQGRLPARRVEVYEEATRVLVERRSADTWSFEEVIDVLGPFAAWLHENRPTGHASRQELCKQVGAAMGRVADEGVDELVERFLDVARAQSGLLVEVGPDRYGFLHGTFREFLAAKEHTRSPAQFRRLLSEHLHDPRWAEVLTLGVALTGAKDADEVDAVLELILRHQSPFEHLLHRNLRFAATCMAESPRWSPATARTILGGLFDAGRYAAEHHFDSLRGAVVTCLRQLYMSRPRLVEPRIVDGLRTPATAGLAAEVLQQVGIANGTVLDALDDACRSPDWSPAAFRSRVVLAQQLEPDVLDRGYLPLRTLADERPGAVAALAAAAPRLQQMLLRSLEKIDPTLRELWGWLLVRAEAPDRGDGTADLEAELLAELRSRATTALGAELWTLAAMAAGLDVVGAQELLVEGFTSGALDRRSVARCFAELAEWLLPPTGDPWWSGLDEGHLVDLFETHLASQHQIRLIGPAWRAFGAGTAAAPAAAALLATVAARTGALAATDEALDAIHAGRSRRSHPEHVALAELLLTRLQRTSSDGLEPRLEEMARSPSTVEARAAVLLLAADPRRPISVEEYDLIAAAVADPAVDMRRRALSVLGRQRPADPVTEEVLDRAHHHASERVEAGDGGAAHAHDNFCSTLLHLTPDRMVDWIVRELPRAPGALTTDGLNAMLAIAPDLDPKHGDIAIDMCRFSVRSGFPSGADLDLLERYCHELEGHRRIHCLALLAAESVLAHRPDPLRRVLDHLNATDPLDGPHLLRAAAWAIGDRPSPIAEVLAAAADDVLAHTGHTVQAVGAALLFDVMLQRDAIANLERRTTSASTAYRALLYALDHDANWHERPHGVVPFGVRLGAVAGRLGRTPRGMRVGVEEAAKTLEIALDSGPAWPKRRAALQVIDALATQWPALFLQAVDGLPVADLARRSARDPQSFSVRRLGIGVLSHFRRLDDDMVDVLAAACRDDATVSEAALRRCLTFEAPIAPNIGKIAGLLRVHDAATVTAASALLGLVGRAPRSTPAERRAAEQALAEAVASSDPFLDLAGDGQGRTLRSMLHAELDGIGWSGNTALVLRHAIGQVATPGFGGGGRRSLPRPNEASTVLERVGIGRAPDPRREQPALTIGDIPSPSWADLGLDGLTSAQQAQLNATIYEIVEIRQGFALAQHMTDSQLDEFELFIEAHDEIGALRWLKENYPSYKETLARIYQEVMAEVSRDAAAIREGLEERL